MLQISHLFGKKVEFTQAAGGLHSFCSLHPELFTMKMIEKFMALFDFDLIFQVDLELLKRLFGNLFKSLPPSIE